ncbi:hypothetical protein EVAR_92912_1 [Eumeta japonica]|uniref:Uncharacterized protein n=1 Tax=Eumeta variegata TaxID=151549 RepID=A0A4C1TCU3_EUMVA|nr:hypothetical protein EVAR_92912_1 [Eumeta japonica]
MSLLETRDFNAWSVWWATSGNVELCDFFNMEEYMYTMMGVSRHLKYRGGKAFFLKCGRCDGVQLRSIRWIGVSHPQTITLSIPKCAPESGPALDPSTVNESTIRQRLGGRSS